jgi:hypothetical protein
MWPVGFTWDVTSQSSDTRWSLLPRGKLGHDLGYVALRVNHNPDGLRSALLQGDSGLPRPLTIAMWCVVWDMVVPLVPAPIGHRHRP